MRTKLLASAAALLLTAGGATAQARTVEHANARFKLQLPDSFSIKQTAQGVQGFSISGNVKVFARSERSVGSSYDFNGHFARWEGLVTSRGFYASLRRVSDRREVNKDGRVSVFRIYDATARRNKTQQPYRVISLAAFSPKHERVYTLAIASHVDTFAKHRAQILSVASSFLPATMRPAAKRVSLRGKLVRRAGKVVSVGRKAPAKVGARSPRALASAKKTKGVRLAMGFAKPRVVTRARSASPSVAKPRSAAKPSATPKASPSRAGQKPNTTQRKAPAIKLRKAPPTKLAKRTPAKAAPHKTPAPKKDSKHRSARASKSSAPLSALLPAGAR